MTRLELLSYIQEHGQVLIQDNDCHWYLIPAGYQDDFWLWVDWMEAAADRNSTSEFDYQDMMVDSPESITIHSWSY